MTMTPIGVLCQLIETRSKQVAFIKDKEVWTYKRLAAEVERLAQGLAERGLRKGDRVALHMANLPEFVVAYHACFRAGLIAAPLNIRFKTAELRPLLQRLRPSLYTGRLADYKVPRVSRSSMKFPGTLPVRSIANRCRRCEQIFQIYPSRNIAESTGIAGRFWCLTSSSDWSPCRVGSCVQELKKQFGLRLRQLGQQTAGLQKLFQIGT